MEEQYQKDYLNQKINEEYKIWKKNTLFMYDLIMIHQMEYPIGTVQWMPDVNNTIFQNDYSVHKLILGTRCPSNQSNYLFTLKHNQNSIINPNQLKQQLSFTETNQNSNIQIQTKILHDGEVNRARHNPHKNTLIATKVMNGQVHIFDYTKQLSKSGYSVSKPQLILCGHENYGYGLSWNLYKEGYLLSGSYDSNICIWNICQATQISSTLKPFIILNYHKGKIFDVQWNKINENVFASCGQDQQIALQIQFIRWDIRQNSKKPFSNKVAHQGSIATLSFNKFSQYLLLSAGQDKEIALWDSRNISKRLHTFQGHNEPIYQVEWNPNIYGVFASGAGDRRAVVWDITKCNSQIKNRDRNSPEMIFIHGGHRSRVMQLSWNKNNNLVLASIQQNHIINIWEMAQCLYNDTY